MIALTTVAVAETFVGKSITFRKEGWIRSRPADALKMHRGQLLIRNAAQVEHGLDVRANDPWIIEVAV